MDMTSPSGARGSPRCGAGGGIAILPTAPERQRNSDNDHPYRHGSDFHYLTGFDEPGAWLLLDSDGRSTLLCREKNAEREIWDGYRLGPEAAPARLGVDEAFAVDAIDDVGAGLLANRAAIWVPAGVDGLQHRSTAGWQRCAAASAAACAPRRRSTT